MTSSTIYNPGATTVGRCIRKGVDYDGTPVEYWQELGIEFDLDDIEQPVVDMTPSPAVSSLIVCDANGFPEWRDNLIVGTLKATELYRVVMDGGQNTCTQKPCWPTWRAFGTSRPASTA